ncbi:hypothetical protein AV530_015182 [Patagioenas fasciata monilis]|uniref:Uncharacterized protein n=1 Tax=Patagioenas fasciata monilis TaxID=372326 RepID=A0A1V4K1H5_PATFA|nr:hypothetical protein AV530_015182 [Patagioenas fasciata monilis]
MWAGPVIIVHGPGEARMMDVGDTVKEKIFLEHFFPKEFQDPSWLVFIMPTMDIFQPSSPRMNSVCPLIPQLQGCTE